MYWGHEALRVDRLLRRCATNFLRQPTYLIGEGKNETDWNKKNMPGKNCIQIPEEMGLHVHVRPELDRAELSYRSFWSGYDRH